MTENNMQASDAEKENTEDVLTVSGEDAADRHDKERTTEEVRQGHTGDHLRRILGISFFGVVLVFLVLYMCESPQSQANEISWRNNSPHTGNASRNATAPYGRGL